MPDKNIEFWLTPLEEEHCIGFRIGNVQGSLHIRSAIDMQQKLSEVLSMWIGKTALEQLEVAFEIAKRKKGKTS